MGSGCSGKVAVKIQNPENKIDNIEIVSKNVEYIRKKKNYLFNTDISESSFVELSTPRSGKLTK